MPQHKLQLQFQDYIACKQSISNCILDKYVIFEKIDSGSTGEIYRGMNDHTKRQVALKFINMRKFRNFASYEYIRKSINNQIKNLTTVNSEHVIKLYDVYKNKDFYVLVLQYCNGTNLAQYIYQRRQRRLSEDQIIDFMKQLIKGIVSLHSYKIIHRDIKSQNIMLHNGILKIVDLGFSKHIQKNPYSRHTNFVGTLCNMAPQVINCESYGYKADYWSLGVVLYQMVYGKLPFSPVKREKTYEQIRQKNLFSNAGKINGQKPSQQLLDLMKKLLQRNQQRRISQKQLLEYSSFKDHHNYLPPKLPLAQPISHIQASSISGLILSQSPDQKQQGQNIQSKLQESTHKIQNQSFQLSKAHTLSKLSVIEKETKISEIDQFQNTQFAILKQYFLDCKKTQFILNNIIMPLEQSQILDFNQRKTIELMYLIACRCYVNLSCLRADTKETQNYMVNNLRAMTQSINHQVIQRYFIYSKKLTIAEGQIKHVVSDTILNFTHKSAIQTKNRYLTGNQIQQSPTLRKKERKTNSSLDQKQKQEQKTLTLSTSPKTSINKSDGDNTTNQKSVLQSKLAGYTRQQQIQYTYHVYIKMILPLFQKNKQINNYKLWKILLNYQKINNITQAMLRQSNFEDQVARILEIIEH